VYGTLLVLNKVAGSVQVFIANRGNAPCMPSVHKPPRVAEAKLEPFCS
jgi:hypothetical protein